MLQNSNAFVQTFEKGLQILEFLVEQKVVSVTSVAKRMGMQKSASYRFLNTLRLHGYVSKTEQNTYQLTDRLAQLGNGILPRREFHEAVSHFFDNLVKKIKNKNGICNLGLWNGREIIYAVQSANEEYLLLSVGHTVPAYCSALGKAVLSTFSPEEIAAYMQKTDFKPFTEKTITNPEQFRAELDETRKKGFALMDDELYPGLKGLAIPVRTDAGPARYAVSVTQTIYGTADEFVVDMLPSLRETVEDIESYMKRNGIH